MDLGISGRKAIVCGSSRGLGRACAILPGFIDTDRFQHGIEANAAALGKSEQQMRAEREQQVPAKRIGRPDEFGEACAFLCSAQAGYITGQNLLLDGGLHNSAF